METKKMKYPFETSSSELQAVLHILEVTGTIKERLQISASQMQENIFVAQVNILKLHGRINCLHKIVMELQENSHQFSLNISELQDKIYKPDIRKSQNQHLLLICQEKKNYSEERVSIPEFETMVESPITWLPPSRGRSLVQVILKVIMISQEIKISIENIGIETNHLQASFFDLESKVSKIQLHKDGLLNTEDCTLQELVQQLTEYKCTLEKREEEKALLKQKVFELDKRLVEEKLFSNKIEAQIQNQQRVANSEISKLQKSVKDLLSSNMKLEETINWSLERNGVLGVKLATLKNILAEEQFQFSEKEAKTNHQWQVYINQAESLQGILSEMFTENTDLKETIKILDQEKVQLQTTVQGSELQSKLKSEKLNVEIQQDDQLGAKCSGNSLQEKSKTMQKNNIKLIRGMEKLEVGKQLPENTVNKLETKVTKENLCCDEKSTQMKSQWKTTDCDANNCPETTTEKLLDNTNKACETLVTIEKAETMIDLVNSEIKVELTDKMLGCIGNEIPDMINQSTLAVFKNTHLFEMPTELMESNKQLQAYIENLMEEKCLLAAMVSELEKKVREIQQHVDENEVQKKNTFCEGIPTISIPQESECKQLFDHKNVFMFQDEENHFQDAMVAEQEKKFAREEFHSSELAVQMEIQKKAYVAENKSLQNIIKDVQEKNEELKETVKNHEEEKKSLETRLVELESILCMDQLHGCEIQAQQKYQIMLLENQKCQLEDMVDDLLDENGTLDVDVDKSLLQITEDETGSDLKEQHCFSELKAKNDVEPAGKVCETTKLQGETKELEERSRRYKLIVEKYRVEKEFLAESLSKCKNLFKKQLIYYRESVADLTNQLKEANIKVQQLQEKLNTHNNAKLQEIINKSGEEIFFPHGSSVCHSEGQCRKSMPMGPEHHTSNITNPDNPRQQPQNCPESKKYLKLHVQLPEEKNDSKTLDLKKNQQQETIKELENSSEQIQKAMENIEREKKMLELNVTQLKKMLDFEQYTSNKLKVYLKNKCKILADQNNDLQEMITELWDDNITFQVSIDNLEKENKLLKFKITELKNEMKMNQECCIDKAVQKDIPKPIDLQSKLQRPENSNLNFQTTIAKLCRDRILPEVVVSNFEKKNECLNYQLKEVDIENNHIHKAGKELQDSNAKLQDTIVKTEHNNILLIETSGNLQDNVIEEDNLSIVLLNNSQTVVAYSENSIQQELKKNSSENPHLLIESLAEEKLEFRDSQINNEPKEENLYVSKNVFQPDSQKDFTWAIQERKRIDVAVENLSGEISFPEVSIIKLEKPISEDQLHPQGTERSTIDSSHQHKTRTEAINNIQDIVTDRHRQVKEKKEFSAAALIIDEQDHCTSKAASQSDILWNSADTEVRNNYLQGTTESLDNMKDLEIIQIVKMKKETVLAADSKLQEKVEEEPWDAEKAAPVCADQAPVIDPESIDQLEKAVTPLKRIREANGITLNHQEEKELQKITHSDRETELSEEEFKDISHINQSCPA
uniref:putative leucine-rich repeat-containing protein DDB_G0290503 n=1 Tax=Pristiophorus japonicus TaxID=55135 RepID=UPI00398F4694